MVSRQSVIRFYLTAALLLAALASSAGAAVYTFAFGTPDANPTTHSATVAVYLHETSTDGTSPLTDDGGLYSFGLTASISSGPGMIGGITVSTAFDESNTPTPTYPSATAQVWSQQNLNFLLGPTPDAAGNVLLATVNLSQLTDDTTLKVSDYGPNSQTIDYAGAIIDPSDSATVLVAVPEPSTATFALIAGGLAALRRPRHRD